MRIILASIVVIAIAALAIRGYYLVKKMDEF